MISSVTGPSSTSSISTLQPSNQSQLPGMPVIQAIVNRCGVIFSGMNREEAEALSKELLLGTSTLLDELPKKAQITDLYKDPLPLNPTEAKHLYQIVQSFPLSLKSLTLMELLGLNIYLSLRFLSNAGCIVKNSIERFCRLWMQGQISLVTYFDLHTPHTLTTVEFAKKLQDLITEIVKGYDKLGTGMPKCKKLKKHYVNVQASIQLLSKLFQIADSVDFFQNVSCQAILELHPFLQPIPQDPEKLYSTFQDFLEFLLCLFESTESMQPRQGANLIKELKRMQERSELIYYANPTHRVQIAEVIEMPEEEEDFQTTWLKILADEQKQMILFLSKYLKFFEHEPSLKSYQSSPEQDKKVEAITLHTLNIQSGSSLRVQKERFSNPALVKPSLRRGQTPAKPGHLLMVEIEHFRTFFELFEMLISFLEAYICKCDPEYIRIHAHIIRAHSTSVSFFRYLTHASVCQTGRKIHLQKKPESHICPMQCNPGFLLSQVSRNDEEVWLKHNFHKATAFLHVIQSIPDFPEVHQKALFTLLFSLEEEVKQLIDSGHPALIERARKETEASNVKHLKDTALAIIDYDPLYTLIREYLTIVYPKLALLQISHAKKCIRFLKKLPNAIYQQHKTAILREFENFFIDQMIPFCLVHILEQDLAFLLPSEESAPEKQIPFLESPIGLYLFMGELEEAFIEKNIELESPQEVLLPLPALHKEESAVGVISEKGKEEIQLTPNPLTSCPKTKMTPPKQTKTIATASCEKPKQEPKTPAPADKLIKNKKLNLDFEIRRAEKMRKLLEIYVELGGHLKRKRQGGTSHRQTVIEEIKSHTTFSYHGGGKTPPPYVRNYLLQAIRKLKALRTSETTKREAYGS